MTWFRYLDALALGIVIGFIAGAITGAVGMWIW